MKIKRYPEYEINKDGTIYRFGRPLKARLSNCGYLVVFLYNNKKRRQEFVHKLLLEAFVENPNSSYNQGNHINGVKHDNRLENLEWCNNSHNQKHAYRLGLRIPNPTRKIDNIQSETIRKCYLVDGISIKKIGNYFNVSKESILYHVNNKAKFYKITTNGLLAKP